MRSTLFRRIVLAPLLAPLLAACSSIQVDADYDPEVDFASYSSFALIHSEPAPGVHELATQRIEEAVVRELDAKGLRQLSATEASLHVFLRVGVEPRTELKDPYYAYREVEVYDLKTLTVDLVDPATRQLVWRGTAETRLPEAKTPEERGERVLQAVRKLLEGYPPR